MTKDEQADQMRRYKIAVESAEIGIWDWDIPKNVLVWDAQMYKLYGIKAKDFDGVYDAWQQVLHPDDMKRGDKEIEMALRGEKDFNTSFRVRWPNGTIRWIKAFAKVERDAEKKPLRMTGVNWDITEMVTAEEALKTKVGELEKLNDMMIDRELKMIELKEEIRALKNHIKEHS